MVDVMILKKNLNVVSLVSMAWLAHIGSSLHWPLPRAARARGSQGVQFGGGGHAADGVSWPGQATHRQAAAVTPAVPVKRDRPKK